MTIRIFPTISIAEHINKILDAHDASAISFIPTGTVGAFDVQAAISEVASEAAVQANFDGGNP
jgi:hypothetical protein